MIRRKIKFEIKIFFNDWEIVQYSGPSYTTSVREQRHAWIDQEKWSELKNYKWARAKVFAGSVSLWLGISIKQAQVRTNDWNTFISTLNEVDNQIDFYNCLSRFLLLTIDTRLITWILSANARFYFFSPGKEQKSPKTILLFCK